MADQVSDELIAQFRAITGAPQRQAAQYISVSGGDLETAIASYYAAQEDNVEDEPNDSDYVDEDDQAQEPHPEPHPTYGGGRRLGDGPSDPPPATIASTSKPKSKFKPVQRGGIATLGDYGAEGRNEDSDDDDEKQDLFAGGEKSGLAVQNPDDLKKRILEKAQRRGPPEKAAAPPKKSAFKGSARTLGGDDTPSQEIPAAPRAPEPAERVERTLHFWRDGFSVDDGDLFRNDDPRNAELLNLIRQGRAPLRIMNVDPGQEVDVEIKQHEGDYVKPKAKYKPFGGSGNRLGSPTPGASGVAMPGAFETAPPALAAQNAAGAGQTTTAVDDSQPAVSLRISLGSGTRLPARFNTHQTIGDVYNFVRRAEPGGREFVLQTTFPSTELKDLSQVLGDMPEFKRGGVVVQKYI